MCRRGSITKESKPEQAKKELRIRAALFFDGTLNNMFNTNDRKADNTAYHKHGEYKDSAGLRRDPKADSTSYGNEYTNVAWLKTHLQIPVDGEYLYLEPTYIEGIGTIDHESDNDEGYRYGTGNTGVKGKVEKGINILKAKLSSKIGNNRNKIKIKELKLDVFGFSRGAAAARYFAARMLFNIQESQFGLLPMLTYVLKYEGYDIDEITVCFVGLFDTVSSLGAMDTSLERSNVEELSLHAVSGADAVFHIAAADEHRRNFALTDITAAKKAGKGKEIFLPGVHCDIGGSYWDRTYEYIQVYGTHTPHLPVSPKIIEEDINRLIRQGWFRRSDIENAWHGGHLTEDAAESPFAQAVNAGSEVFIRRYGRDGKGIRNLYSRIALHLMKEEAMKHGLIFSSEIESSTNTTITNTDTEGKPIPLEIKHAYTLAVKIAQNTIQESDLMTNEPLPQLLRHDYFHFSACWKKYGSVAQYASHVPRYKNVHRKRKIHHG